MIPNLPAFLREGVDRAAYLHKWAENADSGDYLLTKADAIAAGIAQTYDYDPVFNMDIEERIDFEQSAPHWHPLLGFTRAELESIDAILAKRGMVLMSDACGLRAVVDYDGDT